MSAEYPTIEECLNMPASKARGYVCVKAVGATIASRADSFGLIFLDDPLTVHVRNVSSNMPSTPIEYVSFSEMGEAWEVD